MSAINTLFSCQIFLRFAEQFVLISNDRICKKLLETSRWHLKPLFFRGSVSNGKIKLTSYVLKSKVWQNTITILRNCRLQQLHLFQSLTIVLTIQPYAVLYALPLMINQLKYIYYILYNLHCTIECTVLYNKFNTQLYFCVIFR